VTGCILRPATADDADAIASVHTSARRQAMPWLPALHSDDETRAWIRDVVLPGQTVWVADRDGQVVGVAALDEGMLEQLYVHPDAQGQGVGTALLMKIMRLSPAGLGLWTFQRNAAARAFYERHGFVAVEMTDGAGNEEREPDVRYRWPPGETAS
jgi:GNAT superfamily N-acetyltransferase